MNNKLKQFCLSSLEKNYNEPNEKKINIKKDVLDIIIKSDDLEFKGILYCMLSENQRYYIFEVDDVVSFKKEFYTAFLLECFTFKGENDFIPSQYFATYELAGWIIGWYKKRLFNADEFLKFQNTIKKIYQNSDRDIKILIINGLFESLFINKKISKIFSNWKRDNVMNIAYQLGLNPRLSIPKEL